MGHYKHDHDDVREKIEALLRDKKLVGACKMCGDPYTWAYNSSSELLRKLAHESGLEAQSGLSGVCAFCGRERK